MPIALSGTPVNSTSGGTTATSITVALASTTVGAYNVIALSANTSGTGVDPAPPTPAGWTLLGTAGKTGSPYHRLSVFGRFYQSGDGTSVAITIAALGNLSAVTAAYTSVDTTTPVVAGESRFQPLAASVTAYNTGSITIGGPRWLLSFFANRTNGTWSALTDTVRGTQITASSANVAYEDTAGDVAAGTYNRTATYSAGTSVGNTGILALNPAVGGTTYAAVAAMASGSAFAGQAGIGGSVAMVSSTTLSGAAVATLAGVAAMTSSTALAATAATTLSSWLAKRPLYVAHRGGSVDYVEHTRDAYTQAIANGATAINIDAVRCSTGEFVASHDTTTGRVFGTNYTIATTPWSTLSSLTTTTGGYPIELVADLLAAFPNVVAFVENKANSSDDTALLDMLDARGGKDRIVIKQYYTAAQVATDAHARGYTTWGYYYAADLTNLAATHTRWDLLGLDYLDTNTADWATIKSYGKPVLGHVIPSVAGANQAFSLGADGIMTGKIVGVIPNLAGAAVMSSATSFVGAANRIQSGAATMSSVSALVAAATRVTSAGATFTSASALTAAATRVTPAAATFTSGTALTAAATTIRPAAATLTSATSLNSAATVTRSAAATMTSASSLTTATTATRPVAATLLSASSLTSAATVVAPSASAATMTSGTALTGATSRTTATVAAMVSTTALTGTGVRTSPTATAMVSGSTLTGATIRLTVTDTTMLSGSLLAATTARSTVAASVMTSQTALDAVLTVDTSGDRDIDVTAGLEPRGKSARIAARAATATLSPPGVFAGIVARDMHATMTPRSATASLENA